MVIQNRTLITAATFTSLSLVGMSYTFLGTSLPSVRSYIGTDIERASLLTAFLQLGFAITNFAGGILSDRMARERVLLSGCFFTGSAALLFGLHHGYLFNLLITTAMGIGAGLVQSGSNALLVGLYPDRKGTILNLHHTLFAVGSLIGPLIMGHLITHHIPWQFGFSALGLVFWSLSLFFFFAKGGTAPLPSKASLLQVKGLLRERDFMILLLVCFLAIGAQFALLFFAVTFLKEAKGFSIGVASVSLSVYLILLGMGRLACSWLSLRLRSSTIILGLLVFFLVTLTTTWQGKEWISAIALILSGLACSGIFPSLLALTGTLYENVAGTALGILAMMSGLGGMSVCWIAGLISERTTLTVGFVAFVISCLASLVLFGLSYPHFLKKEKRLRQASTNLFR